MQKPLFLYLDSTNGINIYYINSMQYPPSLRVGRRKACMQKFPCANASSTRLRARKLHPWHPAARNAGFPQLRARKLFPRESQAFQQPAARTQAAPGRAHADTLPAARTQALPSRAHAGFYISTSKLRERKLHPAARTQAALWFLYCLINKIYKLYIVYIYI